MREKREESFLTAKGKKVKKYKWREFMHAKEMSRWHKIDFSLNGQ